MQSFYELAAHRPFYRRIADIVLPYSGRLALEIKPLSMLHWCTLERLYRAAARVGENAVLEIGAYKGAATALMATAMKRSRCNGPLISIEVGGKHDHPTMPSTDIIADMRATLSAYGVADRVQILEGWSGDPDIFNRSIAALGGRKIGLMVVDADGSVERDFQLYRPHLAPNAIFVCDDYITVESARTKSETVVPWISKMVASGTMKEIAVVPWGTWFGRYLG